MSSYDTYGTLNEKAFPYQTTQEWPTICKSIAMPVNTTAVIWNKRLHGNEGNMKSTIKKSPYDIYLSYLNQGKLGFQFSTVAGKAVFFPRVFCPYTGQDCLEWRESKGLGTVYSTSALYARDAKPYNVCLIDIDEGFRLMSRVERIPAEQVKIGMRVKMKVHVNDDEDPYPVFVPVAEQ